MRPNALKVAVFEHFKAKFSEKDDRKINFRSGGFRKISKDQNELLEGPIIIEEIKEAVWGCGGEKSPGPDLYKAVLHFAKYSHLNQGCNDSFIALIPKVKDPLSLGEYRPIHLMGCISKVISKVLAERLKKVISTVISQEQTAYVKGKNIVDGPLIVNELITWAKRTKKKMFILKVDFEKAFDNLNWNYLFNTLDQMGFGKTWIGWIKGLITTARVSVLVNGSPTAQFNLQKGVRQGDPLSPYLFITAMEGLIVALKEAIRKDLFKGMDLPRDGPRIAGLHFADDALFVGVWDETNLKNLMKILRCFNQASGLKVNWNKSTLTGIGVSPLETGRMAVLIGCKEKKLPFEYLGMQIGAHMNSSSAWKGLVDRFDKKLGSWKINSLSMGGRLTLCKSVLGGLGVYLFSLFKAPVKVLSRLEKIRRDFFWGVKDGNRKICWVAWEKTLNSLDKGGLGIGSLRAQNMALLAKWWCRFRNEDNSLWKSVIIALHGPSGSLGCGPSTGVWGKIANLNRDIDTAKLSFQGLFYKELGDGCKTNFWDDVWCGNKTLRHCLPRLAALDRLDNCCVADRIDVTDGTNRFRWDWTRSITRGRELRQLKELENKCSKIQMTGVGEDKWLWRLDRSGTFTVSSLRKMLDDSRLKKCGPCTRWNTLVPLKIRLVFWRAKLDRLPTLDNLITRGAYAGSNLCTLCKIRQESANHIFALCAKSTEVRRTVNRWWDVFSENCSSMDEVLGSYNGSNKVSRNETIRDAIIQAYVWVVWKGRNGVIFKSEAFNTLRAANDIQSLVFSWCCNRSSFGKNMTWIDWSCNPKLL